MGIKRMIKQGGAVNVVSMEQAFREFIIEKEARNLSPKTIINYQESFEAFMSFHNLPRQAAVSDMTVLHFYDWIAAMKKDGIKPSSINHYLRDCRAFFYWCMDSSRKYINPSFKIKTIEAQEEQLKLFNDDEIKALLVRPRKGDSFVDWRMWVIVNWVMGTGNRAATICEVKIGDIDFTDKEIALAHTKNKKAQIIPLSPALELVLREYIRTWRNSVSDDGWLFPNVGEEKLTTNALRQSFARYCADRGVERHNIHGLRHSFAKGFVRNNGNMFTLQKVLGHSDLSMTRRYVKLFSEDIKADYDKYSPLDTIKRSSKRTLVVKRK